MLKRVTTGAANILDSVQRILSWPVKYWLEAGHASTLRLRDEDGVGLCCIVARIFSMP